jgi:hypothetical protein
VRTDNQISNILQVCSRSRNEYYNENLRIRNWTPFRNQLTKYEQCRVLYKLIKSTTQCKSQRFCETLRRSYLILRDHENSETGTLPRVTVVNSTCHTLRTFFFRFINLFAICRDTFSKRCGGRRGRVEECSVAPLCNKR